MTLDVNIDRSEACSEEMAWPDRGRNCGQPIRIPSSSILRYAAVGAPRKCDAALLPDGRSRNTTSPHRGRVSGTDARSSDGTILTPNPARRRTPDAKTVRTIVCEVACCARPRFGHCSPPANPGEWWSPRSAPSRTSSISTALSGTYQIRPAANYTFASHSSDSVGESRDASAHKRREESVTSSSPAADPPIRRRITSSPLRLPWSRRINRVERLIGRWLGVRPLWL